MFVGVHKYVMKNFYDLNLPVKLLRDDIDLSSYPEFKEFHWAVWNDNADKYLTTEGMDYLSTMGFKVQTWYDGGMKPGTIVLFRGNKNQFMDIHCDRGPVWCINLIWGCSKSEMVWYSPHENIDLSTEMCSVGSPYFKYLPEDCDVIESTFSTGPVLARIDTPHNVINYDPDNFRWCLSIRDLGCNWSWEETVEHFKPWLKQ